MNSQPHPIHLQDNGRPPARSFQSAGRSFRPGPCIPQRCNRLPRASLRRLLPPHGTAGQTCLALLCAAGLVAAVGCSALAPPPAVPFASEDWTYHGSQGSKLTSQHYVLYTTCQSKPFVDTMPAFLETCWQAYTELVPIEKPPDRPLETYLFGKRWQWEQFTDEFAPQRAATYKRIRTGGYSERGITVSHYGNRRSTLSVLAHEGLHQYLEATRGARIPAWLNEGLATRFEAFELDADNRPIFDARRNYLRLNGLRSAMNADARAPLEEILSTHAGVEIRKESSHVRGYYSQVWSLVLYLLEPPATNPYYDGFQLLLRELGTDAMTRRTRAFLAADSEGRMSEGEAVFRAYITNDLKTFQTDYEQFLHRLLFQDA